MTFDPASLPRDPDRLIEIIIGLQERNAHLQGMVDALKRVVYCPRSEKLINDAAQLPLDLSDAVITETPAAANDDGVRQSTKPCPPRPKAARNIGALPKHLPRCEVAIRTRRQGLPVLWRCPACDRGRRERTARRGPGGDPGQAHPPAALWVPVLRRNRGAGQNAAAAGGEWDGDHRVGDLNSGWEICLAFALEPADRICCGATASISIGRPWSTGYCGRPS
jgi:hypothetical protein